jgi:transcriptional regulator with XRE-family HTH domain
VTGEQIAFGSRLRRERERRQITLEAVANSTKISRALLGSLEMGDTSQWPKGIYRRAFLREYANAVGLPAESLMNEFLRLFPELGRGDAERNGAERPDMRLTLAHDPRATAQAVALRALAAGFDCCVVLAASSALAVARGTNFWMVAAGVALLYQACSMLALGGSVGFAMVNGRFSRARGVSTQTQLPRPSSRELLRIVASSPRPEPSVADEDVEGGYLENARSAS